MEPLIRPVRVLRPKSDSIGGYCTPARCEGEATHTAIVQSIGAGSTRPSPSPRRLGGSLALPNPGGPAAVDVVTSLWVLRYAILKGMPSPVRYAVVRKYLERHGWTLARTTGSHHVFTKPGAPRPFPVAVHNGMVKYGYYREAQRLCEAK
jgi:predicted RNA binding protein YcfA (HicA-like mRNA interferase family)